MDTSENPLEPEEREESGSLTLPAVSVHDTLARVGVGVARRQSEPGSLKFDDRCQQLEGLGSSPVLPQCTGISHFSFLKRHSSSLIDSVCSSRG